MTATTKDHASALSVDPARFSGSHGSHGSETGAVLNRVRDWLGRFISTTTDADLDILTLWAAHTHVVGEVYSTPRLMLDSLMPGSGKTTVLEHLQRLSHSPMQMSSVSSVALLVRLLENGPRTLLLDEVDRTLDPKNPGVGELIAVLNSGYKVGASRPTLMPTKGNGWEAKDMPTFAPVAMAGNSPNLPDDTRSRAIRVSLMPDLSGAVEPSDWEDIEPDAHDLAESLIEAMDSVRDAARAAKPTLPEGCTGRMREKWRPLARVAEVAGGRWPKAVAHLIERDLKEAEMEREAGLSKRPPAYVLLEDLRQVIVDGEKFVPTSDLVPRLIQHNPDYWGKGSAYGKDLTAQRMGRMLAGSKIFTTQIDRQRGYIVEVFTEAWRRMGIGLSTDTATPSLQTVQTVQTAEPCTDCTRCGQALLLDATRQRGICEGCYRKRHS